jgi:hypothetical protein
MKHSQRSSRKPAPKAGTPQPNLEAFQASEKAREIETALNQLIAVRMENFNSNLALGRGMWRANRKLVEATKWPEPYRTLYMQANDGQEPTDDTVEKGCSIEELRKEELPQARRIAAERAAKDRLSPATNLINDHGAVEDAPTTTYILLAQRFEDGKDLEWIQDVELSLDEYDKLRRYLAQLRGLAKDAA